MITPKIPKDVVLSKEDCIFILENLKGRTKFYDKQFGYMGKEYCEDLAGLEILAIDTIISKLQSLE